LRTQAGAPAVDPYANDAHPDTTLLYGLSAQHEIECTPAQVEAFLRCVGGLDAGACVRVEWQCGGGGGGGGGVKAHWRVDASHGAVCSIALGLRRASTAVAECGALTVAKAKKAKAAVSSVRALQALCALSSSAVRTCTVCHCHGPDNKLPAASKTELH
jgi:hypothetical protein